jgi:hypothetical protein
LAGRRLCPYRANGFDGKVLCRWGIANANGNSYCHADSDAHTDSNTDSHIYSNTYCHADGHANTDAHADSHTNTDGNADGHGNSYAHADSNADCNCPRKPDAYTDRNSKHYTQAYSNPATSANSGAAPVVAGRADLSAVVPRLRDEGG